MDLQWLRSHLCYCFLLWKQLNIHPFMPKENGKRSKPVQYQACKSDIPIKIYTSLCIIHLYVCLDFMSRHPTNSLDFTWWIKVSRSHGWIAHWLQFWSLTETTLADTRHVLESLSNYGGQNCLIIWVPGCRISPQWMYKFVIFQIFLMSAKHPISYFNSSNQFVGYNLIRLIRTIQRDATWGISKVSFNAVQSESDSALGDATSM